MGLFAKKLKDIMTTEVELIAPDANLRAAAEKMRRLDVGSLPVGTDSKVAGIITDRDLVVRALADGRDPLMTRVGDIMTRDVVHCYVDSDVTEAATLMKDKQIRRLLVFDRDEKLAGIVSLGDLAVDYGQDKVTGDVLQKVSEPSSPKS